MTTVHETAVQTLSMLEQRLRRIDFVINGDSGDPSTIEGEASGSAGARLRTLERNLNALAAKSFTVSDVLQLQAEHPELFHPAEAQSNPSTLPPSALVQLVLAHEDLFRTSASRLTTLNDVKDVPDSSSLSKLLAMEDRIKGLQAKQVEQAREVAELRLRSAKVVERWYQDGILDMGNRWAEWEERLKDCEILVRRREAAKRRDEEMV